MQDAVYVDQATDVRLRSSTTRGALNPSSGYAEQIGDVEQLIETTIDEVDADLALPGGEQIVVVQAP